MFIYKNKGGNLVTVTSEDGERPEIPGAEWLSEEEEAAVFKARGVGQKFGDEVKFTKAGVPIPLTIKQLAAHQAKNKAA